MRAPLNQSTCTSLGRVLLLGIAITALAGCQEPSTPSVPAPTAPAPPALSDTLDDARRALQLGKHGRAATIAWRIVEREPENFDARLLLASAYQLAGKHQDALNEADVAVDLKPDAAGAWLTRTAALASLGRHQHAIASAEKALSLDSTSAGAMRNLAEIYGAKGDAKTQREWLDKLIAAHPDDVDARLTVARLHVAARELNQARAVVAKVVERVPGRLDAQMMYALVAFELDDYLVAMDRSQIVLQQRPEHELADRIFRASFYVAAAKDATCRFGPRPWEPDDVRKILTTFEEQGLTGTEVFFVIDAELHADADVQARVRRASAECRAAKRIP